MARGVSQLCDWMDMITHSAGSTTIASAALATMSPMLAEQRQQAKQARKGRNQGGRGTFFSFTHLAERAGRDPVSHCVLCGIVGRRAYSRETSVSGPALSHPTGELN